MNSSDISIEARPAAVVTAPASKSVSHRYLMGAALAQGVSTVRHTLESADLARTRAVLAAAGATLEALPQSTPESGVWRVVGMNGRPRGGTVAAPLACDVGESGTTCRLLTAVLAAGEGVFRIHGAGRMHERPIGELTDALARLGAAVTFEGRPGCPPLLLRTEGLDPTRCGGEVQLGMDISSQYFSGLLLAAPLGRAPLTVTLCGRKAVSWPYVGLTLQCLTDFGIGFDVLTRPHENAPGLSCRSAAGASCARPRLAACACSCIPACTAQATTRWRATGPEPHTCWRRARWGGGRSACGGCGPIPCRGTAPS